MKLSTRIIVALFVISVFFAPHSSTIAEEFNPNYIISDEELQDWQCMGRSDIQAFLNGKNSYLKDYRTEDAYGTKRMAADIIYQSAKEYEINPKYLLVKLQKEQSLITDPDPSQKQLDGATGYGITDGCGWDCEMYENNKGFGKQVDSAAGIMRWYYEHMFSESWIKTAGKTYAIDGQTIVPQTNATAFLYTYTPHLHGNGNFWKLWQKWFEQVYPNGTLVKTTDNSDIYLIQDGTKRLFTSMSALVSRFDPKMIITVPSSELSRYNTGNPISLPNYAVLKNGSDYYLLDYDTVRPFESYEVVKKLGYYPDEIIEVSSEDISDFNIGKIITADVQHVLGRLVRVKETDSLYYLKDGIYSPILDPKIAEVNFPNLEFEDIPIDELKNYTAGSAVLFKNGTLFGITGSNKIYATEDGKKRHIASEEVFNCLGFHWENIIWINEFAGMIHKTGEAIYLRSDEKVGRQESNDTQNYDQTAVAQEQEKQEEAVQDQSVMVRTPANDVSYSGPKFSTEIDAYLVADYESQEILAAKNIDTVRPTASLTKVLTAYRLVQEGLNLSRSTTYSPAEHDAKYHYYKIVEGEKILNKNLMEAMLVSSLNTPAYMLASNIDPTYDQFVARMNKQVQNWGLEKTKFNDPFGGEQNVTTAREYLTIFSKSTKNKTVKDTLGMKSYQYDEVLDLDGRISHYDVHSNDLVNKTGLGFNIIASKTGYLDESGAVLAMLVERKTDAKKFVIITMGNPDITNRFDEPKRLTDWALETF